MDKIFSIGKKYNLKIIQDSAHIIGAKFKNKYLVNFGDTCTYSMHPLKTLMFIDLAVLLSLIKALANKLYLIEKSWFKK